MIEELEPYCKTVKKSPSSQDSKFPNASNSTCEKTIRNLLQPDSRVFSFRNLLETKSNLKVSRKSPQANILPPKQVLRAQSNCRAKSKSPKKGAFKISEQCARNGRLDHENSVGIKSSELDRQFGIEITMNFEYSDVERAKSSTCKDALSQRQSSAQRSNSKTPKLPRKEKIAVDRFKMKEKETEGKKEQQNFMLVCSKQKFLSKRKKGKESVFGFIFRKYMVFRVKNISLKIGHLMEINHCL